MRMLMGLLMAGWVLGGSSLRAQFVPEQQGGFGDEWGGRRRWYPNPDYQEQMMRERLASIMETPRAQGMDNWAWHDAVEDALVSLGQSNNIVVPLIARESESRSGYESDAQEVAAFRLVNPGLNPRAAVAAWEARQESAALAGSAAKGSFAPWKVERVMGMKSELAFPHHLFYAIEYQVAQPGTTPAHAPQRQVLAVAADSKVQVISDDATLARFLRIEVPAIRTEAAQGRVAGAAAVLGMARFAMLYQPEGITVTRETQTLTAHLNGAGHRVKASVTFDDGGRVAAVAVADDAVAVPPAAPVAAPNPTAVPAMPE